MTKISRGALTTGGPNFRDAVSLDAVRDWGSVHIAGTNPAVTTALTAVSSSGGYPTPSAPVSLEIVSTDANNAAAGTGLRTVDIHGIGPDWLPQQQQVTLNGLTPVPVPGTWLRVYLVHGLEVGTYMDGATPTTYPGQITLREAGAGPEWTTIWAEGTVGLGEAQIAAYTVPPAYRAYITEMSILPESNKAVTVAMLIRENADQVVAPYAAGRVRYMLRGISAPVSIDETLSYGPFEGPCDIIFLAKVASGTAAVTVTFNVMLEGGPALI